MTLGPLGRFVPRTRRTRFYCGGAGAVLLLSGTLLFPSIVEHFVRAKIQSLVADQLNAELQYGGFAYHWPYGITIESAKLVSRDGAGQPISLLDVARLDLTLAELPLGSGPLVIKELTVESPVVHVIKTGDGTLGVKTLVKTSDGPSPPSRKLSEIFALRHVAISSGQVVYEDRRAPGVAPVTWGGLQLDLKTEPSMPAVYAYQFNAGMAPAAFQANGDVNIDDWVVHLASGTLDAKLAPDPTTETIPAAVRRAIRNYAVAGQLHLTAAGTIPLNSVDQTSLNGVVELSDGKVALNRYGVDLRRLAVAAGYSLAARPPGATAPSLRVDLKNLDADTDHGVLKLSGGTLALADDGWRGDGLAGEARLASASPSLASSSGPAKLLKGIDPRGVLRFTGQASGSGAALSHYAVDATAQDVAFAIPDLPHRVDSLAGTIHLADGSLEARGVNARIGSRIVIRLDQAHAALDAGGWRPGSAAGGVTFIEPAPPAAASKGLLDRLDPRGDIEFTVTPAASTAATQPSFAAVLTPRDLSIAVPTAPQRIERIRGTIRVDSDSARAENVTAAYGAQQLSLARATVPLADVANHVRVDDISASVNFESTPTKYPGVLDDVLTKLGPIGVYDIAGNVDIDRASRPGKPLVDYRFSVTTAGAGAISPTVVNTPVIFPKASAVVTPDLVDLTDVDLPVFGGRVTGKLKVRLDQNRPRYEGTFDLRSIELEDAKVLWADLKGAPKELSGRTNGRLHLWGDVPTGKKTFLDTVRAEGMIQVANGYLYDVPVLRQIADWLKVDRGSIIGDAAATFAVEDRVIELKRGVFSAPVLAVQGGGDIGLDGALKLTVTAASQRSRTSPFGGKTEFVKGLITAANNALAGAGEWGLYEFHVSGTQDDPRLEVTTPRISQTIDSLRKNIGDFTRSLQTR